MKGFNLLSDLKEMESMEDINHTFHIDNNTPRRHLIHSDILTLDPTNLLDL